MDEIKTEIKTVEDMSGKVTASELEMKDPEDGLSVIVKHEFPSQLQYNFDVTGNCKESVTLTGCCMKHAPRGQATNVLMVDERQVLPKNKIEKIEVKCLTQINDE